MKDKGVAVSHMHSISTQTEKKRRNEKSPTIPDENPSKIKVNTQAPQIKKI